MRALLAMFALLSALYISSSSAQAVATYAQPQTFSFGTLDAEQVNFTSDVRYAIISVVAIVVFAFSPFYFSSSGAAGMLTADLYENLRMRFKTTSCGILAFMTLMAEFWLDTLFQVFFIITASVYLLQSMTQFEEVPDSDPVEFNPDATVLIPHDQTHFVIALVLLFASMFVYKLGSSFMRSLSYFGLSALATFIAWGGFIALLVVSIIDAVGIPADSGRGSGEEILLIIFAVVAVLWTTVQFITRLGFWSQDVDDRASLVVFSQTKLN